MVKTQVIKITLFPNDHSFPCDHKIDYNGNITYICQVLYTNKDDFPAGISRDAGHFMVGPSLTDGAEKVKGKVKVQLNIHGVVEIELIPDEEARRGCARRQKLVVSENLDVTMTKNEMREAQEKENILGEQDKIVEQTKEKRNTLESFIYDTRSKLLNTYRSMATDSEAKKISKKLQENEEWLYKEGDEETEQVYNRKLEDLKKLLDPIESRYKDENARKEATKALQTCIQEKRSAADLLSFSLKKKVINECIQVEQWLIYLTQLHDSLPKNATPIYCSTAISAIMHAFKRSCEVLMRSKPPLPKYDEPVDSEQKHDTDGKC